MTPQNNPAGPEQGNQEIPEEIIERIQNEANTYADEHYHLFAGVHNAMGVGYYAGAKAEYIRHLTSLSIPKEGLRWVKALDRLPYETDRVCFKSNGVVFTGWVVPHRMWFIEINGQTFPYRFVEWLEELPHPSAEQAPALEGEISALSAQLEEKTRECEEYRDYLSGLLGWINFPMISAERVRKILSKYPSKTDKP